MWLAQSMKQAVPTADADQGISTIVGDQMGVVTRGEVRQLPIYGPGGYVWLPESGASVLVIKGGPGGQEQCVAGMRQGAPEASMQLPSRSLHILVRGNGTELLHTTEGTDILIPLRSGSSFRQR